MTLIQCSFLVGFVKGPETDTEVFLTTSRRKVGSEVGLSLD